MIRKKINIDVFSRTLEFIISNDLPAEILKIEKRHSMDVGMDPDIEGCFIKGKQGAYYILVDEKYISYNTISHEIFHAAHGICEYLCIEDEETKAWLCGYLSGNIYRHLAEQKITIKHGN